jgi:arylformamidase
MSTYYDLSHPFDENSYHPFGFPSFVNKQHFVSHGCRHAIGTFSLHTSTHIDAPYHMVEDGKRLEEMDLKELIGSAVIVDLSQFYGIETPPSRGVEGEYLEKGLSLANLEVKEGDALILYLGRSNQYLTDTYRYYSDYSTLSFELCQWIAQHKVRLVGLDAPDVDLQQEYLSPPFAPVNHRYLLSRNIYIIENIGGEVEKLLGKRVELIPAPLKIKGEYASGAPVRLLARV